jgi:NTE family protein
MHIHTIEGGDEIKHLGVASKFNTEFEFLKHLKGVGRRCAGAWLDANIADVGERSTVNLGEVFI